jgi:hypothetical protein
MWTIQAEMVSRHEILQKLRSGLTEGIVVTDLCAPATDQVDTVLLGASHTRVPLANQVYVFVDLVGLDVVHDDGMDVFSASEHLGEGAFHILVKVLTFLGAVDERR